MVKNIEDLEEGRGKRGQMKQALQRLKRKSNDDEWGGGDNPDRKRNKPGRFKVVKRAVWDD